MLMIATVHNQHGYTVCVCLHKGIKGTSHFCKIKLYTVYMCVYTHIYIYSLFFSRALECSFSVIIKGFIHFKECLASWTAEMMMPSAALSCETHSNLIAEILAAVSNKEQSTRRALNSWAWCGRTMGGWLIRQDWLSWRDWCLLKDHLFSWADQRDKNHSCSSPENIFRKLCRCPPPKNIGHRLSIFLENNTHWSTSRQWSASDFIYLFIFVATQRLCIWSTDGWQITQIN